MPPAQPKFTSSGDGVKRDAKEALKEAQAHRQADAQETQKGAGGGHLKVPDIRDTLYWALAAGFTSVIPLIASGINIDFSPWQWGLTTTLALISAAKSVQNYVRYRRAQKDQGN